MNATSKQPRRWRRRFIWTVITLPVLGFVARATLPLALPMVLRKVAGNFGMTCVYDRLELNLFSGDAGIWGLEFKPKEGGNAILAADYCHGNISVLNLFKGKLNVWRVEADGVDVNIDRNADGHIPLLDRFIVATSKNAATPPPTPASPGQPASMDLSSPLRVDALRLDHIRVHIHDRGVSPEIDTELAMDLRLSDLGSMVRPAKFEMNLSADPLLDTLRINGEGQSAGKTLNAKINVLVRGIRLKPAAAYLAPLGIRPVSDGITLTATGQVHTAPAPNNAEGFTASVAFDHLSATADRQESLALDHLNIDTGVIDTQSIRIDRCILEGARVTAGRASDGNLQIAGIEYDPAQMAIKPPPATQPTTPSPLLTALMKEKWSVGELALKNGSINFDDQGITPAVKVSLIADELSASSIDHDPKNLNTSVTLKGRLRAPELIRNITIDGTATPFADDKKFTVTADATGIKPDAVKPYLDQIGLESTLKDGRFTVAANASLSINDTITAGANVTHFEFADDVPLLQLADVTVTNASLNPSTGAISVADIELAGPGIKVVRDSTGISALGLRTKPVVADATPIKQMSKPATKPVAPPINLAALPKITVHQFRWKDIRIDLEDRSVMPATHITISEIGLSGRDLSSDLSAGTAGDFKAWLVSPQVANRLKVDGRVITEQDRIKVVASADGSGLNLIPFAPYLKPLGVEPTLRDGQLSASLTAVLEMGSPEQALSLDAGNLRVSAGLLTLASFEEAGLDKISFDREGLRVGQIKVISPHISVLRNVDGSLAAAGFRTLPASEIEPVRTVPTTTPPAIPASASVPLVVIVPILNISQASVDWTDLAVHPNVSATATASVQLVDLTLGKDAPPAKVRILAQVAGAVDYVDIDGPLTIGATRQSADLNIDVHQLRAGPLAAYFPPGVGCSLKDGSFQTGIKADAWLNPSGGHGAELTVKSLDFKDGTESLLHLDSVHVKASRIDLPDTALAMDEISMQGLQTHAEKLPTGELTCMGLLISADHNPPRDTGLRPVPATSPSQSNPQGPEDRVTTASTTGPSVQDLLAASHRVLPSITLDKLDLNVANFTLRDLSRPESKDLVVRDLHLRNLNRIDWLGKDADSKPPTKLQFVCRIDPLVDQVQADISVTPFVTRQPHLHVDFAATGIHGDGLTQLVPELKDQLDGSDMSDGSLLAHLSIEAKLDRRSPIDFDLSHGFDLSFVLDKVQYRSQPVGPVLAGVDEIRSEGIRIAPADSLVHFKTIEITQPIGLITQDSAGIHALGWTYKLPTATVQPASNPPVIIKKIEPGKPAVETPPTRPANEIRIDKLLVSGLDFQVQDTAVNPPLVIPLNGLDIEVRNLSSLAPYEDKPIRFIAVVNAGKVNLPKRGSNPPVMEQRDLFSQITANGEMSLYPALHGYAKTSVSSLDLAALQGAAAQFNETLTGGLYDSTVDLRFDPTGAVVVNSRFTLTDLSLSEPSDGLIFRALHLPVPLDAAIGAVQGADGSIGLPVNLSVDPKNISYAAVTEAAAAAVLNVITTAITAAPAKAIDDVGGLIGLGGSKTPQNLTTTLPFAAGSAALEPGQSAALSRLLQQLHDDPSLTVTLKQQLCDGDVELSRVRANPTPEQSASVESQLRSRKAQLLQLRADAAGRARADLVSLGELAAAGSLNHLRAIDRELAATDESLDQVGELLKPGADRLANRRTKAAALQLATDRLSAVRAALLAGGVDRDRLKVLSAQFNPAEDPQGAKVTILIVKKK